VLERSNKTKTIILDLQPNEFNNDDGAYDRLAELLPYYYRNKFVRELLNEIDPYESVKTLSYLYRYNSKVLPILKETFIPSSEPIRYGFEPIEVSQDKSLELTNDDHLEILDFQEIETFKRFLKEAKKNNHKVINIKPAGVNVVNLHGINLLLFPILLKKKKRKPQHHA
jgi:hypothetical protein